MVVPRPPDGPKGKRTPNPIRSMTQVYCFGCGDGGRLGLGDDKSQSTPKHLSPLVELLPARDQLSLVSISCGALHSAAVTDTGELFTWGKGDNGRLGVGDMNTRRVPTGVAALHTRVVVTVSCGADHSMALTDDGQLYSWGSNEGGRLGLGDERERWSPTLVNLDEGVTHISCGASHSLIVTSKSGVHSCGSNNAGQLGIGHKDNSLTFQKVKGLDGRRIVKVVAAASCSMALTDHIEDNGDLFSWGFGRNGRLGHGNKADQLSPKLIAIFDIVKVVDMSSGSGHAGAIDEGGHVYTWGLDQFGQLGHGKDSKISKSMIPNVIRSLVGTRCVKISCGGWHTAVATDEGEIYTFGWGEEYQLGHSSDNNESHPKKLARVSKKGRLVHFLECGDSHTVATLAPPVIDMKRYRAALTIQSTFRMYKSRCFYVKLRALYYEQLRRLEEAAAITIQRYVRGTLARVERMRLKIEKERNIASTNIQRVGRGLLARALYKQLRREKEENDSSTTMQRLWRGHAARRQWARNQVNIDMIRLEQRTVGLQSNIRMILAGIKYRKEKREKKENEAAIVVQCAARVMLARKSRTSLLQARIAAVTIQCCVRKQRARASLDKLRKEHAENGAATYIQKHYRRRLACMELEKRRLDLQDTRNKKATVIQAWVRGSAARALTKRKKEASETGRSSSDLRVDVSHAAFTKDPSPLKAGRTTGVEMNRVGSSGSVYLTRRPVPVKPYELTPKGNKTPPADEVAAAVTIQAAWRGYFTRVVLDAQLLNIKEEALERHFSDKGSPEDAAARKIQLAFRLYRSRLTEQRYNEKRKKKRRSQRRKSVEALVTAAEGSPKTPKKMELPPLKDKFAALKHMFTERQTMAEQMSSRRFEAVTEAEALKHGISSISKSALYLIRKDMPWLTLRNRVNILPTGLCASDLKKVRDGELAEHTERLNGDEIERKKLLEMQLKVGVKTLGSPRTPKTVR